jgi:hypothetical protein
MGKMYLFEADYSTKKLQSIFANKFVKLKNAPQKDLTDKNSSHLYNLTLFSLIYHPLMVTIP